MLVLGRKMGETIVIDNQITVTVLAVKGGRIRLGIEAPSSISIRRSELPAITANSEAPLQGTDRGAIQCTRKLGKEDGYGESAAETLERSLCG